jgi:RecA-family ATPase
MDHTFERPLLIEMIRSSTQEAGQRQKKAGKFGQVPEAEPAAGMFTIRTANEWMVLERQNPTPQMLFGRFWIEGELCILFADTNMGKSILAVQLGNSISRGEAIAPFELHVEPCHVLYIDFELSGKQFELRYTDTKGTYEFASGFFRAEFNPLAETPYEYKTIDEFINNALDYAIRKTGTRVLIIDNITCLRNGTERAADALPLMKHLKGLKTKYNLSILVLAHTPKRNPANPLSRNDLQGSKMLINFADSAFAIGESHAMPGYRYLKQVKQRSSNEMYGTQNVCMCRLERYHSFLRYEFTGTAHEHDHLRRPTQQQRDWLMHQIADLHSQGRSQRQIAARLKLGLASVNGLLKKAKGEVKEQKLSSIAPG